MREKECIPAPACLGYIVARIVYMYTHVVQSSPAHDRAGKSYIPYFTTRREYIFANSHARKVAASAASLTRLGWDIVYRMDLFFATPLCALETRARRAFIFAVASLAYVSVRSG